MEYYINIARNAAEKELIYRFRYLIYIEEMGKLHMKADHINRLLCDETDLYTTLYYVLINNSIAATLRSQNGIDGPFGSTENIFFDIDQFEGIFDHRSISVNDRLIVDKPYRRSMLYHRMMIKTYTDGLQIGTKLCFISCDDSLLPMYIRYGFRIYREPALLKSGERRHRLLLLLCDKGHLEKVRSPFLSHLPDGLDDHGHFASSAERNLDLELQYEFDNIK